MLKKFIAHSLVFSLVFNNLAFATQSIIELDFKDSHTPQRLHVIPRMSNVGDVSHVEIDAENQQVVVHKHGKQRDNPDDLQSVLPRSESVPRATNPIIIPKHNIINLPWELEPEKLTLFILNHTAWLSPLSEDVYKLEFKGGLLGGMKPWGGGKKELVVDVTKFTVDCKGRNDYPSGTIGAKFCNKNGNGSGNFGIPVINKPYVPPVDKEWEKHCEKACNPFGNQKAPYIPLLEDKKPDLKKVNINPVKAPQIKVDDKKIHQTVAKEVEKVMQPLINKRKAKFRHVFEEMPDIIMEELAPYRGGELPKKTLDGIISNVSWKIDGLLKDTDLFKLYWQDGTIKLENGRWWPSIVDPMSRTGVLSAYAGLKKKYDEELEKFKKSQKIEEEKLEKAKKEQAIKEEQIRLEQERIKIEKMAVPDEYDRHYIEKYLLPILQQLHTSPAYKSYDAFISNKGTGYRVGMNINDYWQQSWLDSKKNGEAARNFSLPFYERPSHIMTQTDYDRLYIEMAILPTIRKFNSHPAYKDYQTFINNPGTGYKVGMNPEDYWQIWLNSEKWGEAARQNPLTSQYQIPTHSIRDTETYDRQFIETAILPVIRKYTSHPAYQDYRSFINSTGTGYEKGNDLQDYMNLQSWKTWKGGGIVKDFPKYEVPDTCNPFYGDYEKVKRLQNFINTTAWEGVYNYAELEGFSKEDVQYVESRKKETITFDSYMKEQFDDQMLEDWGVKNWREASLNEAEVPKFMRVGLWDSLGKKGLQKLIQTFPKQTQELLGALNKYKKELFARERVPKSKTTLKAAEQELKGNQIDLAKQRGVTYDHVTKVQNAQKGLKDHIQDINNRLSYPKLPDLERKALQEQLAKVSKLLDHTEGFVPKVTK